MSWLIRQIAGVEEKVGGRKTGAIVGTSGKVIRAGLTDKQASVLKQELNERHPDSIFVIEQEKDR